MARLQLFLILITLTVGKAIAQPYWQQQLKVQIDVTLDDRHSFLNGYENIDYTNHSPDTLHYIYMHLWPNAYKNDRTPFARQMDLNGNTSFYYSKPKDRGYIDSLQFTIDGQTVDYYSADNVPDIARIDLPQPLLPGHTIKIATPFRVKIPKVFSRMGHTGQAYYISQWFPKPAVFDRKGWHPISYLDQGEFYSEYGSYDVNITLPKNYIVMATGNCTNEGEMKWLDGLSKLPFPNDTLYTRGWPESSPETKTLHYHEDNVHDFAWFADKRWVVRKDTVVSPGNGLLVTAWTAFLPMHEKYWKKGTDALKETIKHYGKWVGPYPYKTVKAVEGDMHAGGGMEYPTVTIIDKTASVSDLRTTLIHEAGHNWFYGMLGTNERDHAWMDEGINTFYEQKTSKDLNLHTDTSKIKKTKGVAVSLNENTLYYEDVATHTDQPIEQTSANFTKLNYGVDVYYKTVLMLKWLEAYMGNTEFDDAIKQYFEIWQYKHPYPEDFKNAMQEHTYKSLDWFFDTVMHTDKRIDFQITHSYTYQNRDYITVHNNTGVFSPLKVDAYLGDSIVASGWADPFIGTSSITWPTTKWTTLRINDSIPDGKTTNNVYRPSALFHNFGIQVKPFFGTNQSDKDKLFIAPALGYNQYNGFMLGLLFHDLTIPENRFRFALAPMYSFNSKTFAGTGSVGYVWYPGNVFKEILLQGDAKTFDCNEISTGLPAPLYASYLKIAPSLNFTFNEHNPLSPVTRTLTLKAYSITENNFDLGADSLSKPSLKEQQKIYGLLRYLHRNDRTYNPFNYSLEGQIGADFAKINLEGNVRIDYNTKNKSLYVRGYIGKFFAINDNPALTERYYLNTSYTGLDDYLYDGTYIGRTAANSIGAQQISIQEGGFKIPTYNTVGQSDNWLIAINLKTDLPLGKLPIRLFLDGGLLPNETPTIADPGSTKILYDGGVELHLIKDIVSLYIPIIMSNDFSNYLKNSFGAKNQFGRSISFTLQLQNINWLKAPGKGLKFATN